jgi:hypothetical protein
MAFVWHLGPHVRCDFVSYSGINLTGVRYIVRVHATGSRKGTFRTDQLKSIVVMGPIGTRVILATWPERENWQNYPWRCVRMLAGQRFRNPEGNEGVRIPDLDWLDPFDAKRVNANMQESFPQVERLEDGKGFTFGRTRGTLRDCELKDNIRAIWIEREDDPISISKPTV